MFLSVTIILLEGGGGICLLAGSKTLLFSLAHLFITLHVLQSTQRASQINYLLVPSINCTLTSHQDNIWRCQRDTVEESEGGICRIPDEERDMTTRPMWRQTNLSLVPVCLMSHSLATRWGDPRYAPPVNARLFFPLLFCSPLPPFTSSVGFPHTRHHWHK